MDGGRSGDSKGGNFRDCLSAIFRLNAKRSVHVNFLYPHLPLSAEFRLRFPLSMMFSVLLSAACVISLAAAQLSYAPINVTCPGNLIRYGNNGLSPQEASYISARKKKATQSLQTWLESVNLTNFDVATFLSNESNAPTMGLAFSGGGYRAMLNGAGVFQGYYYYP